MGANMVNINLIAYVMLGSKHSGAAMSILMLKKEKKANTVLKYEGQGILLPVKMARTQYKRENRFKKKKIAKKKQRCNWLCCNRTEMKYFLKEVRNEIFSIFSTFGN